MALDTFLVFEPGIPFGANILNANISMQSSVNHPVTVYGRIHGVLLPSPSIPANRLDCENAPLTIADVDWTWGATVTGTWYTSNDISGILSEIVSQPGYSSTSLIIIQIRTLNMVVATKRFYAYDTDPADAPILCVNWGLAREVYFKGMHRGEWRKMR